MRPSAHPEALDACPARGFAPDRRFLWMLVGLALATRLLWVLVVHPPGDYVFSDMARYVERAQALATHGERLGVRTQAWQAWGTHTLLALPLRIFGLQSFVPAAILWGLLGAVAVVVSYLLACRVCSRPWMPKVVGIAVLLWHPSLSNTGFFLSETPFLCFQLCSTYFLAVVLQEGRRAIPAGVCSAIAFALRPQAAPFFALVFLWWMLRRGRAPAVGLRQLAGVAVPLVLMLGYASWRFHAHTGRWIGVAENAEMNFTAGRCHNIVTQAFPNEAQRLASERRRDTSDGRRVSLPEYRVLAKTFPPEHPLALRPAMGSETIRFVGYVGEPEVHRAIRAECYRRTGVLEQIRYSVVNLMLQWFVSHQWPEMERGSKWFLPPVEVFKYLYQVLVWLPSLLGAGLAAVAAWRRPERALCVLQLVTSMAVAAAFFGSIRLRTPYDPYAILLAVEGWAWLLAWARRLRG